MRYPAGRSRNIPVATPVNAQRDDETSAGDTESEPYDSGYDDGSGDNRQNGSPDIDNGINQAIKKIKEMDPNTLASLAKAFLGNK